MTARAHEVTLARPQDEFRVIRVPDFIADAWKSERPGTVLGVIEEASPTLNRATLRLPRSLDAPVHKLQAGTSNAPPTEIIMTTGYFEMNRIRIDNPTLEGVVTRNQNFLPNVMDPRYRAYLLSLESAEANKTKEEVKEGKPREDNSENSRLFRYFSSEDNTPSSTAASTPMKRAQQPQIDMQESLGKLFKLLESKGDEGATLRDVQTTLLLPPHLIRQLLEQIAEPQRERLGRKSSFTLKPQFRGGGSNL